MYEHFWDLVLPELKWMQSLSTTTYTWLNEEKRFGLIRSLSYLKRFRILSKVFLFHIPFIYWNLVQSLRNETNAVVRIYGVGYTGATFAITVARLMYQNFAGEILQLLNLTVHFQNACTRPGRY
jgi:hypothetical protein